jgi:hypothetical protein
MRPQEMVQHMQGRLHVLTVASCLRQLNIVNDHFPDLLGPLILMQQVLSQCRRSDLGNMLVLGDGENFSFRQTAQSDAILDADHDNLLGWARRDAYKLAPDLGCKH